MGPSKWPSRTFRDLTIDAARVEKANTLVSFLWVHSLSWRDTPLIGSVCGGRPCFPSRPLLSPSVIRLDLPVRRSAAPRLSPRPRVTCPWFLKPSLLTKCPRKYSHGRFVENGVAGFIPSLSSTHLSHMFPACKQHTSVHNLSTSSAVPLDSSPYVAYVFCRSCAPISADFRTCPTS